MPLPAHLNDLVSLLKPTQILTCILDQLLGARPVVQHREESPDSSARIIDNHPRNFKHSSKDGGWEHLESYHSFSGWSLAGMSVKRPLRHSLAHALLISHTEPFLDG